MPRMFVNLNSISGFHNKNRYINYLRYAQMRHRTL